MTAIKYSVVLLWLVSVAISGQDTIRVQTFTFDDITKRNGTFLFPSAEPWERVLMEYTLKCDPKTTQDKFDCGEWDYLTYTVITDSSGRFDSTAVNLPLFQVAGGYPDSVSYSMANVNNTIRTTFRNVVRTDTTALGVGFVADGTGSVSEFSGPGPRRTMFVYTATELKAAGLIAGNITGLLLYPLAGGTLMDFQIRIGHTTLAELPDSIPSPGNTIEVYRKNVEVTAGTFPFHFYTPFAWDGNSNILVEFINNGTAEGNFGFKGAGFARRGFALAGNLNAYSFTAGDHIEMNRTVFSKLDQEITITFWAYGDPAKLPNRNNIVEGLDGSNRRMLNVHLPWENSTVYWDCGYDSTSGSFDRIEKAVLPQTIRGRWNHWAFVKNSSSGHMAIYLNGNLFFEGNGKNRRLKGLKRFRIGGGTNGWYEGMISECQVYDKALDLGTIRSYMNKQANLNHPFRSNLIAYYPAVAGSGTNIVDASDNGISAVGFGAPMRTAVRAREIFLGTGRIDRIPTVGFEQGVFKQTIMTTVNDSQVPVKDYSLVRYNRPVEDRSYRPSDPDYPAIATDTILVRLANRYSYTFDTDGNKVDSAVVPAQETLRQQYRRYFDPVVSFELGRFITPYGIGLSLGPAGFRWIYDVTDYAPLLRDNVTISAGNQQELISLAFVFVKGTPPRNVVQIKQVYPLGSVDYSKVVAGTSLTPQNITFQPGVVEAALRTRTTGHQFDNQTNCAEFCQRHHYIDINGVKRFQWLLWNECGLNPVYPQGGTWQLNRAGWCPGAPVYDYFHNLTPWVSAGGEIVVDYGIEPDTSGTEHGNWVVTAHLFGYGAANFTTDVAVEEILAPSTWEYRRRMNPVCAEPIVVISNNGSETLTNVKINYGQVNATRSDFEWRGSLKFMEKDTIVLPPLEWLELRDTSEFSVFLEYPNGVNDQNPANNTKISQMILAPLFSGNLTIELKTNRRASEQYSWILRKADGAVVASGDNLQSEHLYTMDYNLQDGCYEFELTNRYGYGLDYWFVRNELGSGFLRFKNGGKLVHSFNPDFGSKAWLQFRIGERPRMLRSTDSLVFSADSVNQEVMQTCFVTPGNTRGLVVEEVKVTSIRGHFRLHDVRPAITGEPVYLAYGDTMYITVAYQRPDQGNSSGQLQIVTNDDSAKLQVIRLIGSTGTTSSADDVYYDSATNLSVIPMPAGEGSHARLSVQPAMLGKTLLMEMYDALGVRIAVIARQAIVSTDVSFLLPSGLSAGIYHIRALIDNSNHFVTFPYTR